MLNLNPKTAAAPTMVTAGQADSSNQAQALTSGPGSNGLGVSGAAGT